MTNSNSIQSARETLAQNRRHLKPGDDKKVGDLCNTLNGLKDKSAHVADFRRLKNTIADALKVHVGKSDWSDQADQPLYDSLMAICNMIDSEIANRAAAGAAFGGDEPIISNVGWYDAKSGEAIRLFASNERVSSRNGGDAEFGFGSHSSGDDVVVGDLVNGLIKGPRTGSIKAALESGTQTAGGYTVPDFITRDFIDRLRNASTFIRAGAQTAFIDGRTKIARLENDATPSWRAENADVAESDPLFGQITLTPKSLSVLVKVSYELLQDSVNAGEILTRALVQGMATELDRAALFGSGSDNQPLGLSNTAGIGLVSMGVNGLAPANYDPMVDLLYELEVDNASAPTAAIWNPRTAKSFRKFKDGQGQPLRAPAPIDQLLMLASNSVPVNETVGTSTNCSSVIIGDFTQAILAVREELTIIMLNEAYAKQGQIAFWARMRADVAFAHPESFAKLVGIKP